MKKKNYYINCSSIFFPIKTGIRPSMYTGSAVVGLKQCSLCYFEVLTKTYLSQVLKHNLKQPVKMSNTLLATTTTVMSTFWLVV